MPIEKIIELVDETLTKRGLVRGFPIKVNGRLRSTLGRVIYDAFNIRVMEFSRNYMEVAKEEEMKAVVLHEAAHAIAFLEDRSTRHGHDKFFKTICSEIGCQNDQTRFQQMSEQTSKALDVKNEGKRKIGVIDGKTKYSIYCKRCGELVASHKRQSKLTKHPEDYGCQLCGGELEVIQNW